MTEATLELIEARQIELASMIEELQRKTTALHLPATTIDLASGEWYAGSVLDKHGRVQHHLVAASTKDDLTFDEAQEWAEQLGLSMPTKQETRLLVAHQFDRLKGLSWIWTCERHTDSSSAWYCYLFDGNVYCLSRSASGGAVAVRRVKP